MEENPERARDFGLCSLGVSHILVAICWLAKTKVAIAKINHGFGLSCRSTLSTFPFTPKGLAPEAPVRRGQDRRESVPIIAGAVTRAEGKPDVSGTGRRSKGDPSGSSGGQRPNVSLRTCRRIFGSFRRAFGLVDPRSSDRDSMTLGSCERDLRIMRLAASVAVTDRNQVPGLSPDGESPERVETSVTAPSGPSRVRGYFRSPRSPSGDHPPMWRHRHQTMPPLRA